MEEPGWTMDSYMLRLPLNEHTLLHWHMDQVYTESVKKSNIIMMILIMLLLLIIIPIIIIKSKKVKKKS